MTKQGKFKKITYGLSVVAISILTGLPIFAQGFYPPYIYSNLKPVAIILIEIAKVTCSMR